MTISFDQQINNLKFDERNLANHSNGKLKYPHKRKEILFKWDMFKLGNNKFPFLPIK